MKILLTPPMAWDSFFHLNHDDQRRMFAIFRQFAAPGAALMFTSGSGHGVAMGEFEGEPLFHASLDTEENRELLDEAGLEVVAHVVEDDVCGGRTVWLARLGEFRTARGILRTYVPNRDMGSQENNYVP